MAGGGGGELEVKYHIKSRSEVDLYNFFPIKKKD